MNGWSYLAIDLPDEAVGPAVEFWAAALGARPGEPWARHPECFSLESADGESFVFVQVIDGPARLHPDFEVDDRPAATHRLTGLGARVVRSRDSWTTLASPGGLEFCLVDAREHRTRPAPIGPPGARQRPVQVCLDLPSRSADREIDFWRVATGWGWRPGDAPEFAGKLFPPAGSPYQLLLQRLGPDDQGSSTRAHLDLGADDRAREADRLESLGAIRRQSGDGWITLRDPVGLDFCVTATSPDLP